MTASAEKRSVWTRLVERYESWRFRRTYGRYADHSRAIEAARRDFYAHVNEDDDD